MRFDTYADLFNDWVLPQSLHTIDLLDVMHFSQIECEHGSKNGLQGSVIKLIYLNKLGCGICSKRSRDICTHNATSN